MKARKRALLDQLIRGIRKVFTNKKYTLLFLLLLAAFGSYMAITKPASTAYNFIVLPFTVTIVFLIIMMIFGYIPGSIGIYDKLCQAGFVNKAGIPPELIEKATERGLTVWKFRTLGIPMEKWIENQTFLETALNISIIKFKSIDGKNEIAVCSVPATGDLPEVCEWSDDLLPDEPTVLRLGEGLAEPVEINIHKTPHILVGGSTGSGKTVLIKLIMHECLMHGHQVILVDYKGGVDFGSRRWAELNGVCTDYDTTIKVLKNLVLQLTQRRDILRTSGLSNIDDFNRIFGNHLPHIFFVCDELAEMLDKSGADKETKEKINEIIALLSTIARLGRAFGIHLVLGTQRPDANVLPGQIKNNMDVRICGRADQVLSQIILDTSDAADKIPKDGQGRFLMADGMLFQAYYYDDSKIGKESGVY